jgi:hypothetical protein
MKTSSAIWALLCVVVISGVALADKASGVVTKEHGFTITTPTAWKPLPELAEQAKQTTIKTGGAALLKAEAVCMGDIAKAQFVLVSAADVKLGAGKVQVQLEAFGTGIKTGLEGSGGKLISFSSKAVGKTVVSRMVFDLKGLTMTGTAIALADKGGIIHGLAAICGNKADDKAGAATCEGVLASFTHTYAAKDLQAL